MRITERRSCLPGLTRLVVAVGVALLPASSVAQTLPRVDGPLTIEQAVDLALDKSLRVKAASADARTAGSMQREALAPFWPQLSANGYLNDQRMGPNVYTSAGNTMARNYQVFSADQNRDANVTLMYPLFSGGRDYYGYKAATRRAEAGRESLRGAEVDVAMQARLDYIAALREGENLRVTRDLLRTVDERLRITRAQLDAGRVPRYYVLRDETERANAVQMEALAQSRLEQAIVALKTTLGIDLTSDVMLTDRLQYTPASVSVEEGTREAGERQPDLKAAIKQREAVAAEVRAAYGNYFPQVSLSYMYDWAWMKPRTEPSSSSDGYSIGLVVTLPLFDGFLRENALKTAKARLDRAVQAEGLVRQQIAKDVNQAVLTLRAAEKAVDASRKGLDQAEEEFRVVRERFDSGRGIQLEILDAQAAVTRAGFNAVNALAEYQSATAMWLRATGRTR
jgi:outer membrane protein TolC